LNLQLVNAVDADFILAEVAEVLARSGGQQDCF